MALNEFTTQSAWGGMYLSATTTATIGVADTWYAFPAANLAQSTDFPFNNFKYDRGKLLPQLPGIYLLQLTLTTSGAINDQIGFRFKCINGATAIYSDAILTYDSKGGNEWLNNNCAIQHYVEVDPEGVNTSLGLEAKNFDDAVDIDVEFLTFNAIKIY